MKKGKGLFSGIYEKRIADFH